MRAYLTAALETAEGAAEEATSAVCLLEATSSIIGCQITWLHLPNEVIPCCTYAKEMVVVETLEDYQQP
jgi:hypothetical protein